MNHMPFNVPDSIGKDENERFQELIFKLYQCCQDRIQRQAIEFHLPDAELRCLRLFGQEPTLTAKAIANRMGVVKSRITKLIDGLVGKRLIQKSKNPEDSRIWLLRLTPHGREKLALINQSLTSANEEILSRMTAEQRNTLLIHLEVLKRSMEAVK